MTVREAFEKILYAITYDAHNKDGQIDVAAVQMICKQQLESADPIERLFSRLHGVDPNFYLYAVHPSAASDDYRPLARAWLLLSPQARERVLADWRQIT